MAASRGSAASGTAAASSARRCKAACRRRRASSARCSSPAPPACRGRAGAPRGPHGLAAHLLQGQHRPRSVARRGARRRPGPWLGGLGRHEEAGVAAARLAASRCGRPADAFDSGHAPGSFCSPRLPPGRSCRVSRAAVPAASAGFTAGTGLALPAPDWRKFLSHLLPPRPAVTRFLRLLALLLPLAAALPADAAGAHQGHRRRRGRPREPADRLRPGGRPEQHRRQAGQRRVHPRIADRHAGAAGREHPRPGGEARPPRTSPR